MDLFELVEFIFGFFIGFYFELVVVNWIVFVIFLFEKCVLGLYYNIVVVFDWDGSIVGKYCKMYIFDDLVYYEKFYFILGDIGFELIQIFLGKLGVLVCWD